MPASRCRARRTRRSTRPGALAFPSVDLVIGDNRITGAIARTATGPLSGTLAVSAPNLATLAALALVPASGSGEARIAFAPDGTRQSLAVSFSGDGVSYQTIAAGKISGDVHIDDAFGTPLITGNATASALNIGGFHVDTANASANVQGGATRFTATAKSRDLDLSGRVRSPPRQAATRCGSTPSTAAPSACRWRSMRRW